MDDKEALNDEQAKEILERILISKRENLLALARRILSSTPGRRMDEADLVQDVVIALWKDLKSGKLKETSDVYLSRYTYVKTRELAYREHKRIQDSDKRRQQLASKKTALKAAELRSELNLTFDTSVVSAEEVAEVLGYLSDLYRSVGGDTLVIRRALSSDRNLAPVG